MVAATFSLLAERCSCIQINSFISIKPQKNTFIQVFLRPTSSSDPGWNARSEALSGTGGGCETGVFHWTFNYCTIGQTQSVASSKEAATACGSGRVIVSVGNKVNNSNLFLVKKQERLSITGSTSVLQSLILLQWEEGQYKSLVFCPGGLRFDGLFVPDYIRTRSGRSIHHYVKLLSRKWVICSSSRVLLSSALKSINWDKLLWVKKCKTFFHIVSCLPFSSMTDVFAARGSRSDDYTFTGNVASAQIIIWWWNISFHAFNVI